MLLNFVVILFVFALVVAVVMAVVVALVVDLVVARGAVDCLPTTR